MGTLPSAAVTTSVQLGDHTRRHIAARVLPFLFVLYVANYIDRTNLAYAALGMSRDIGFTDRIIGLGVGIFFVTYVAGQTLSPTDRTFPKFLPIDYAAFGCIP